MTLASALLKAKSVGVRNFRDGVSKFIKRHQLFIITEHGNPASVLLPYSDMLELVDILEELEDKQTLKLIRDGRKAAARGVKGILVSRSFSKQG